MTTRKEPHTEAALEAEFARLVRTRLGGKSYKFITSESGAPDRLVFLPGGRIVLVELKRLGGRLSPLQVLWHERSARLGVPVTTLVGISAVDNWITRLEQKD